MPKKDFPAFREATGYDYDYLGNSASATDCTGLIPFAPVDQEQLDSYQDVYHFEPQAISPSEDSKEKK